MDSVKLLGDLDMKILNAGCPKEDGFYMPAEYELHRGTIIIWPVRSGSWIYGAVKARKVFAKIIVNIAKSEEVYVLCQNDIMSNARQVIDDAANIEVNDDAFKDIILSNIHIAAITSDDSWARDVGPTFIKNAAGTLRAVDWCFNAWGGEYDGLYSKWDKDDAVAKSFCKLLDVDVYDAHPFVLEGGAIHSDGEGTVIVTKSCLLSKGRNPTLSMEEIEQKLKDYLGAKKVIWLPYGIFNDETNEHVDNVCAFTSAANVVLAWTDDENDPQYEMSKADYEVLMNETDACGRKFIVHKLHIPKEPVRITEYELAGFEFEDGEDVREAGERLAASYVNFYIANDRVLVPQFNDIMDENAIEVLSECFPDREIEPIYARDIIVGGGNIHCITQQIPR